MEIQNTLFYKEYIAMRQEVDKHKWYESEKAGHDIGFSRALIDWTLRFKSAWIKNHKMLPTPTPVLN